MAVVGGSLSGLALARALQHVPSELVEVSVTVLEAQSEHFMEAENGELDMHRTEGPLLRELGLQDLYHGLTRREDRPRQVRRRELLRGLAASLAPGTVHYGSRVREVCLLADGCFRLEVTNSEEEEEEEEEKERGEEEGEEGKALCSSSEGRRKSLENGREDSRDLTAEQEHKHAYHYLVFATGLSSATCRLIPPTAMARVGLVGDARVQMGLEPFFGLRRITYGATRCLEDGLQVARFITSHAATADAGSQGPEAAQTVPPGLLSFSFGSYSAANWERTRRGRRLAVPAILLLLVLAGWCG